MANNRISAPIKRVFGPDEVSRMFPVSDHSFCKEWDRQETEQIGGVDLCKAVATRTVPGNAADNLLPANCVAEPGLLLPRPQDNFERIRQMNFVREHLSESVDDIVKHLAEKSAENMNAPDNAPAAE